MRLALISDIHGNTEALSRVLTDIDSSRIDIIACLGDIIGYGPEPNQAISAIRNRKIPTIIGNHEMAAIDPRHLGTFNPFAKESMEITTKLLTLASFRFIQGLESSVVIDGCRLVHGFPPDSSQIYATHTSEIARHEAFRQMAEKICFIGHTHGLEIIDFDGNHLSRSQLSEGMRNLDRERQYIISTGSVGQPRDGNNQAKYVIWDSRSYSVDVRYISYDIKVVADKIIEMGLPKIHASRLW
jgi:predicted phosphodiesterase